MTLLSREEFALFENLLNLSQKNVRSVMAEHLRKIYGADNVIETNEFIYAIGEIPIGLLAHMDTVFEDNSVHKTANGKTYIKPLRKVTLYYDQWQETLASGDGCGFDDRAGIYAIIRILQEGFRPTVILTTDEEIGGIGAYQLVKVFDKPLTDLKYLIQLDRRGENDCVFYDLDSKEFETYVESFGFKTAIGSFTDISTICPVWGIAGVNLSIGYNDEHSVRETLNIKAWLDTIEKVKYMLSEKDVPTFEYKARFPVYNGGMYGPYSYGGWYDEDWDDYYYTNESGKCDACGKSFNVFQLLPEVDVDGKTKHYCALCYEHLESCEKCGALYYQKKPSWKRCKECAKELRDVGRKKKNNKSDK